MRNAILALGEVILSRVGFNFDASNSALRSRSEMPPDRSPYVPMFHKESAFLKFGKLIYHISRVTDNAYVASGATQGLAQSE